MATNKFTQNCISCKGSDDPEEARRIVWQNEFVKIVLRTDNQCWLGRCIIVPKEHISPVTLYATRPDILVQIASAIALLNKVYANLYGMKMSNIAQLGNLTEDEQGKKTAEDGYFHSHYHYIPRYDKPVERYGHVFEDPQWGRALNIDPKAGLPVFLPSSDMIAQMKQDIEVSIKATIDEIVNASV